MTGVLLDQTDALRCGTKEFGAMLGRPDLADAIRRSIDFLRVQLKSWSLPDLAPLLWRLLLDGEPVTVEAAAAAGGWTVEQVRAALDRHPGVDFDDQGRIAGLGLTLKPTPHTFSFDGRTFYAFCATDALEFSVALNRSGVVESTCPATGRRIRVEVTPDAVVLVDPPTAVVSKVRPTEAVEDVRTQICALGNFFSSPEAAADWLAHTPDGFLDTVADDFEITRQMLIAVGWAADRLKQPPALSS